jgi:hypothetical protein
MIDKNLSLVGKPAKGRGMDDAITVTLVKRPKRTDWLIMQAATAGCR